MKNLWRYVLSIALCSSTVMAEFVRVDYKDVVFDTQKQLMWQDDSSAKTVKKNWQGAIDYCEELSLAGFNDWYLPNIDELKSIVDKSNSPAIVSGFKNTASYYYWSSTTYAGYTDFAWVVDFNYGYTNYDYETYSLYVRCVRGGQYFDPLTIGGDINITSEVNGTLTLTATPNFGCNFASWSDGDTINPKTITIDSNKTLKAFFNVDKQNYDFVVKDSLTSDNAKLEFETVVKSEATGEELSVNRYEIKAYSSAGDIIWSDGDILIDKSQKIKALFSYGGEKVFKEFNLFKAPTTPTAISPLSYSNNPHAVVVGDMYSDELSKLNNQVEKNRWLKFSGVTSTKKYQFYYEPTQTPVASSNSNVSYTLYKEVNGQKSTVGTKSFSVLDSLEFDLSFEENASYYVKFATDANLLSLNYKFGLFEQASEYADVSVALSHTYILDEHGEIKARVFVPSSVAYDVTLFGESSALATLNLRGEDINISDAQSVVLKAGIYELTLKGEPNKKVFVNLKKSTLNQEIEPNENFYSANIHNYKTKANLKADDTDTYLFTPNSTSLSAKIDSSKNGTISGIEAYLLNTSGEEYGYKYINLDSNSTSIDFSGYDMIAGKSYYLKLNTYGDGELDYNLTINNIAQTISQSEQIYKQLHLQWIKDNEIGVLDTKLEIIEDIKDSGELIILTGDSDNTNDSLYIASQKLSATAYNRFSYRGLSDSDIYWINYNENVDIDNDGRDDSVVDSTELSVQNFYSAINTWAKNSTKKGTLYIYMVDHGANNSFKVASGEVIYSTAFKNEVEKFVNATGREVVIIMEACKSGSFADDFASSSVANKVAFIGSSEPNELSYVDMHGSLSFTKLFLDKLLAGNSLYKAFNDSSTALKNIGGIYTKQSPLFSASTDALKNMVVGGSYAAASMSLTTIDEIFVNDSSTEQTQLDVTSKKINLRAKITAGSGINKVWATVITPDFTPPSINEEYVIPDLTSYTTEQFTYNKDSLEYEGSYQIKTAQSYTGIYEISVYVEDIDGFVYSKKLSLSANGESVFSSSSNSSIATSSSESSSSSSSLSSSSSSIVTSSSLSSSSSSSSVASSSSSSSVNMTHIQLTKGWNLISANVDVNTLAYPIVLVWKYTDNTWQIYTSVELLKNIIKNSNFEEIASISHSDGIWVFADSATTISYEKSNTLSSQHLQNFTNKWNLSGTDKDVQTSAISCSSVEPKSMWKYKNGTWLLNTKVSNSLGLESFTTIYANDGFWVECKE